MAGRVCLYATYESEWQKVEDYVGMLSDVLMTTSDAVGFVPECVADLVSQHGVDGAAAAWMRAWWAAIRNDALIVDTTPEAVAFTRDRFQGFHDSEGAFAQHLLRHEFDDAVDAAVARRGFPLDLIDEWSRHVNWDSVGADLTGHGGAYEVIVVEGGVYVWHVSDLQ